MKAVEVRVLFWAPSLFYRIVFYYLFLRWDRNWDNFVCETQLRRAARDQLLRRSLPRIDPSHARIIPTAYRHQPMLACDRFSGADRPRFCASHGSCICGSPAFTQATHAPGPAARRPISLEGFEVPFRPCVIAIRTASELFQLLGRVEGGEVVLDGSRDLQISYTVRFRRCVYSSKPRKYADL